MSAAGAGLVHSSTSGNLFALDREKCRLKKMKSGTITGARLLQQQMQQGGCRFKVAMLTPTYALVDGYRPRHISDLLSHLRKFCARRGFKLRFVWVMELQKRGAPHYHILIWLPKGVTLPKPDKQGWWPHGWTKIEWARNAVGYIAKYASKEQGGEFPKGSRIHGVGGLNRESATERRWWLSPKWVREHFAIADDPRPAIGGGFYSRINGEWMPSPWEVLMINGVIHIQRKQDDEFQN